MKVFIVEALKYFMLITLKLHRIIPYIQTIQSIIGTVSSSLTLWNRALEIPFHPACIPLPSQLRSNYQIIFWVNHFLLSLKFYTFVCTHKNILANFACVWALYKGNHTVYVLLLLLLNFIFFEIHSLHILFSFISIATRYFLYNWNY